MIAASFARTNLNHTPAAHNHGHHWSTTDTAAGTTEQFSIAMGTEEIDHSVFGNLILTFYVVAPVETGERQPPVFLTERENHSDRGMPVNRMVRVHQAMVATGATDLNREDAFILINFDKIEPPPRPLQYILYLSRSDLWKIVAVDHDHRANGTGA